MPEKTPVTVVETNRVMDFIIKGSDIYAVARTLRLLGKAMARLNENILIIKDEKEARRSKVAFNQDFLDYCISSYS